MTSSSIRRIATTALLAVAATTALTSLGPAAASAPRSVAADGAGWVRFGHFAPSEAAVDVLIDGRPLATDIAFKGVSQYMSVPIGVHRFELRSSEAPGGPSLLSVEAGVPDEGAVTIGAVSTLDGVAAQVYDDALATPAAGAASVRFIHAAPDVAAVDVQVVDGPLLATEVPYPAANEYRAIDPGDYDVEVRPAGASNVLLQVDGWTIEPGTQASIVIVKGLDGRLDVAPVRDSVALAVAPVGGVQTGYGGMADGGGPSSGSGDLVPLVAAAALLAGAGGLTAARLRTRLVRTR